MKSTNIITVENSDTDIEVCVDNTVDVELTVEHTRGEDYEVS